jgi:hypothetical protein
MKIDTDRLNDVQFKKILGALGYTAEEIEIMLAQKKRAANSCQWFKNGDHPDDYPFRPFEDTGEIPLEPREGLVVRYYRNPYPNFSGLSRCPHCRRHMHDHGWIDDLEAEDGRIVCPGDFIIFIDGHYYPVKPDVFHAAFQER